MTTWRGGDGEVALRDGGTYASTAIARLTARAYGGSCVWYVSFCASVRLLLVVDNEKDPDTLPERVLSRRDDGMRSSVDLSFPTNSRPNDPILFLSTGAPHRCCPKRSRRSRT